MLILDTDHLAELDRGTDAGAALLRKLDLQGGDVAITIITAEEQLRGWLAQIHRRHDPHRQVAAYSRLQKLLEGFTDWRVLPWNAAAADMYKALRNRHVRVGSMDLKIASIALLHDATLLSRNLRDFTRVPGLRVEDWLA